MYKINQYEKMIKEEKMEIYNDLFNQYVPSQGKCETLGGEIIRAVNRLAYRFFNDGDIINEGYGEETCNPPARFLIKIVNKKDLPNIYNLANTINSPVEYEEYEKMIDDACLEIVEKTGKLPFDNINEYDMYDF